MERKRIVSITWDSKGLCQGLCLRSSAKGFSVLHAWREEITDSLPETLERGAEILNLDKADTVIAGPLEGFSSHDLQFPAMKKALLAQALKHQLPKYFPYESRDLTSAYQIISQTKEKYELRLWALRTRDWQFLTETVSSSHHKVDMIMSPVCAAQRIFPERNLFSHKMSEDGLWHMQLNEDVPGFDQLVYDETDFDSEHFGASFCLAQYAVSDYYEKDRPGWFKTPVFIRPRRSQMLLKYTYTAALACLILGAALLTVKGKAQYRLWKSNEQLISNKKNELKALSFDPLKAQDIKDVFKETVETPATDQLPDITAIIMELTETIPEDYWVESFFLSNGKISCRIRLKSGTKNGDLYSAVSKVENFTAIKISDSLNGYTLEFRYKLPKPLLKEDNK